MIIAVEKKRILTADNLSGRMLPLFSGEGKARVLTLSGGYA